MEERRKLIKQKLSRMQRKKAFSTFRLRLILVRISMKCLKKLSTKLLQLWKIEEKHCNDICSV
jgi:hypothetical protein